MAEWKLLQIRPASLNQVVSALSQTANGAAGAISVTTDSISVSPATSFNSKTQTTMRLGYQMQQVLRVSIQNVTSQLLASVVDSVVKTGDVSIGSINFGLQRGTVQRMTLEGRTRATADAAGTARLYAQALDAELGSVISLAELSVNTSPVGSTGGSEMPMDNNMARSASIGQQAVTLRYLCCP
ncbi:hypothetical protein WJX81_002166 [Elliptochloris bilobata]|uniref:Uncharacterized protein n=1 Tax=Elliptochloris bilobata TaxID=381761 RepID=A0AAW1RFE4_9CHLO